MFLLAGFIVQLLQEGSTKNPAVPRCQLRRYKSKAYGGWAGDSTGTIRSDEWTDFLVTVKPIASKFRSSTLSSTKWQRMRPRIFFDIRKKAQQMFFLSSWLWRQDTLTRILCEWVPPYFSLDLVKMVSPVEEWEKLSDNLFSVGWLLKISMLKAAVNE